MPTEVENDPFFQLLTDALRAGPASPPWREAVARLREGAGPAGADEFKLLIEARQNLEVGKSYREVRPGPEFTRKVLTGVDAERQPTGGRRLPIAGIVTLLAAIVIVGVVVYVARMIGGGPTGSGAVDELAGTYFPTTAASANFNGPLPEDLRHIGGLNLDSAQGLRLPIDEKSEPDKLGGGIVYAQPVPADEPFASEARVRPVGTLKGGTGPSWIGDQLAEIFVSASPDFSADRATAPHELVWLIRGMSQQVVRDGQVVADVPLRHPGTPLDVRMVVNKDLAVVEVDHQRIWAGTHGLGDSSRYVGVRILTAAPGVVGRKAEPGIVDWKILKK